MASWTDGNVQGGENKGVLSNLIWEAQAEIPSFMLKLKFTDPLRNEDSMHLTRKQQCVLFSQFSTDETKDAKNNISLATFEKKKVKWQNNFVNWTRLDNGSFNSTPWKNADLPENLVFSTR